MRARLFWIAMVALAVLSAIGLASYLGIELPQPELAPGDERVIELEVIWGGDVYTSTMQTSCDVWTGQFDCELRRGGSLGTVISDTMPLAGPIAQADPPGAGTVTTTTWAIDTSPLMVGDYEGWCRLVLTNGTESIYGYIEGQGQELDGYCLVDRFTVSQVCIVPRRFIATLQ